MRLFHPPHIYQNNTIYFITAKTIGGATFFNTPSKKDIFLNVFSNLITQETTKVFAWVLHPNHYHMLLGIPQAKILPRFMARLHASTSRLLNVQDQQPGRKIWYQYWDRCIRSEKDFWCRFNYIHHNPIKHGYFKKQDDLNEYPYSSYRQWLKEKGSEWLTSCFASYPIIDFTIEEHD